MAQQNRQVPQSAQDDLYGNMVDGVQLPEPVTYFMVRNGLASNKPQGGVPHYGGWGVDQPEADKLIGEAIMATYFDPLQFTNQGGKDYMLYTSRNIWVAPIARRFRFDKKSNSSKFQIFALISMKTDNGFVDLGFHVATAGGMQTIELQATLREWMALTKEARKEWDNASATFFRMPVGTFGPFNNKEVGSAKTNFITPIIVQPAKKKLTATNIDSLYVGDDNALEMAELYKEARPWVAEWDKKKEDSGKVVDENLDENLDEDYDDDELPF